MAITCVDCGAEDGDAVNLGWTLGYKKGVVINARCLKCEGELVSMWLLPGVLLIREENDDLFYNHSNREA